MSKTRKLIIALIIVISVLGGLIYYYYKNLYECRECKIGNIALKYDEKYLQEFKKIATIINVDFKDVIVVGQSDNKIATNKEFEIIFRAAEKILHIKKELKLSEEQIKVILKTLLETDDELQIKETTKNNFKIFEAKNSEQTAKIVLKNN